MSVRLRSVNMFDSSVSTWLPMECQKYSTRRGPDWNQARGQYPFGQLERLISHREHLALGYRREPESCGFNVTASRFIQDIG